MKECSHCGVTEKQTRIIFWKRKRYLCNRHRIQFERHGRFIKSSRYETNTYTIVKDVAVVDIFDVKGEKIAETKIDASKVSILKDGRVCKSGGYAYMHHKKLGKVMFHRVLNVTPEDMYTDHINGDKLDNRLCNLRTVTIQQNNFNWVKSKSGKRRGVSWDAANKKFTAYIEKNGKKYWLGRHKCYEDALDARQKAEKALYGQYASSI